MFAPLRKAARAGVAILGHVLILCLVVLGIWLVEEFVHLLFHGQEVRLFGTLPLTYLFQAIDAALIVVFGVFGVIEAVKIMSEKDHE